MSRHVSELHPCRSVPPRARRARATRRAMTSVAVAALVAGCGGGRAAVLGTLPSPAESAATLTRATRLSGPVRIDFTWRLNEAGSRVRGQGVARIEPPYRARLDLFLDNGEGVVSAAVVDDELRLPPGAPDDILPPVDLMWSTLGVFRPLAGSRLEEGARLEGGAERLVYRLADGRTLRYEVRDGAVHSAEIVEDGSVVEEVLLEPDVAAGYPSAARYRNRVDFRELTMERTTVSEATSFPPGIWDPRR